MNAALRLLGAQALLGTARRAPEFPAADTPTGRLLQDLAVSGFGKHAGESPALNDAAGNSSDDSARLLLRGAGVLAVCELAAYVPEAARSDDVVPPLCPAESCSMLPEGEPITDLYRNIFSGKVIPLQWEALRYLAERRMVLPPSLLVPALNMARWNVSLRPMLARAAGERGLWLAALNPDWNMFALSSSGELAPEAWEYGRPTRRKAYFKAARGEDPAGARALFMQDMHSMDATERQALLELFSDGLSMEDEELLEQVLRKDRGREVRRTAAGLLSRLPRSRYVARMGERLLACMANAAQGTSEHEPAAPSWKEGIRHAASGLLKRLRGEKGILPVAPEKYDPSWAADFISEKSPFRQFGPRAYWLYQMAVSVPLAWWTEYCGGTPAELLALSEHSEWKSALQGAWCGALRREAEPQWARALLESGTKNAAWECPGSERLDQAELIRMLPPEERELKRIVRISPETLGEILTREITAEEEGYQLSPELAKRAIAALRARMSRKERDYEFCPIMEALALALPVDMLAGVQDEILRDRPRSSSENTIERPWLSEGIAGFSAIALQRRTLHSYFS